MPIRFVCTHCRRRLSIARRKEGVTIECPQCGATLVVPTEEAAAAADVMDQLVKTSAGPIALNELVVYDDEPPRCALSPSPATAAAASEPCDTVAVSSNMLLVSRRSQYLQAILLLLVATVFFGLGYLMGQGDGIEVVEENVETQPALVEGSIVYRTAAGTVAGDTGAVIVLLPEGKVPPEKMAFEGLRPSDPLHTTRPALRMIGELLGGVYVRADAKGAFSAIVPNEGVYHLLIISAHADRSSEVIVDEVALGKIGRYFTSPGLLVGRRKFRWTLERIGGGICSIEHDFGRDERP